MRMERALRILILVISFGSIISLATFIMRNSLPWFVFAPVLFIAFIASIARIGRDYGKAVSLVAALSYLAFVILLLNIAYSPTLVLGIAMLFFPFLWSIEMKGNNLLRSMRQLGISREGFVRNVFFGIWVTPLVFILTISESLLIYGLHVEEAGKVGMIAIGLPLYVLIFSFTVTPIAEEIFFRGFLLPRIGILLSTLLFALAHFSYGSIAEFVGAFTAGLVFALMRRRSKSVIPSIVAHAAFNLINMLLVFAYIYYVGR